MSGLSSTARINISFLNSPEAEALNSKEFDKMCENPASRAIAAANMKFGQSRRTLQDSLQQVATLASKAASAAVTDLKGSSSAQAHINRLESIKSTWDHLKDSTVAAFHEAQKSIIAINARITDIMKTLAKTTISDSESKSLRAETKKLVQDAKKTESAVTLEINKLDTAGKSVIELASKIDDQAKQQRIETNKKMILEGGVTPGLGNTG